MSFWWIVLALICIPLSIVWLYIAARVAARAVLRTWNERKKEEMRRG